ncbi:Glucose 1-dehydrogenase 1 [Novipirellula galeiformis]|uniref:Glucose 1-dehydrogenase 1 n=1 Tax=Novipirellula galeiformis TaxID=2528004 RepID=A0A5C6CFK9_9BACT|nr:SDR family NAD(P)-dependent oxidoreductase [Novipirellula galeiformis]TWU23410.1 Glucose 1-dehydrogenase 1 [Novipirellula galeiformis]
MSHDKVAVVTGAGSGIGAATAKRFARDGFKVVLNGRTESKLSAVAEEIGVENSLVVTGDVSSEAVVENMIAQTIKTYGRLDVVVNNAGVFVGGTIDKLSAADWDKQMNINAKGPFLVTKAALPHLVKTKGSVVNVSSVSGLGGDWGAFAYDASKGAVTLMTKALALDFAPQGVRINAVAPSLTDTEMAEAVMENDEVVSAFANRIAMGRAGKSEEVADVIAFLASEDARFVTGTIVPVDGGLSASNGQPKLG